jgi:hypothetical protein
MQRFFLTSPGVSVIDPNGKDISQVAIYDESLFVDYLLSAKLTGHKVHVEKLKKLIYTFLEYWQEGERRITITYGNVSLSTMPAQYIELEPNLIHLGERPEDPEREVLSAMTQLTAAIRQGSPHTADLYQQLQDILKKHPTPPVKVFA